MKIKAANTILYCEKWQETVDFYRNGLKLLIISSNNWSVEFKLNEMSRLSVANEARSSINSNQGKGITISLQVADMDQTRIELIEVGITPMPIKEKWDSKAMYIHDSEGNRHKFWMGRLKV